MPNVVKVLRSQNAGVRPPSRSYGEAYVNFADQQFGIIGSANTPVDLLTVTNFSPTATYAIGQFVLQAGNIYRAKVAVPAGAFTASQWDQLATMASITGLYLPIGGGILTGMLTVEGSLIAYIPSGSNNGPFIGSWSGQGNNNFGMQNIGGTLWFGTADGSGQNFNGKVNISSAGALNVSGSILGANVSAAAGGNVYANANVFPNYNTQPGCYLTNGILSWQSNCYMQYNYTTGATRFVQAGLQTFNVDGGGNASVPGTFQAGSTISTPANMVASGNIQAQNLVSIGNMYPSNTDYFLGGSAGARYHQYANTWYWAWNTSSGLLQWVTNGGQQIQFSPVADLTLTNGNGWKPGGGAWAATSDDRTKQDVATYASGLDEILQLEPISFKYNGEGGTPNDGKTYYGLSAQSTQPIMPELVINMDQPVVHLTEGYTLPRADTMLEGQLGTDLGPIPLALVNAVKTLAARVEALENQLSIVSRRN
jgi:hypothetical protein